MFDRRDLDDSQSRAGTAARDPGARLSGPGVPARGDDDPAAVITRREPAVIASLEACAR